MSTIKFLHLPIGQQFTYRDAHYSKVAPLIACNLADGSRRMIPRSALVTVDEGAVPTTTAQRGKASPALAVLERYHQAAIGELRSLAAESPQVETACDRLEALKAELAKLLVNE